MSILNPEITGFLADIGFLVKMLSNRWATFSPKNFENISNFEGRGQTQWLIKKNKCIGKMWEKQLKKKVRKRPASLIKLSLWDRVLFLLVQINHPVSP